MLIYNKFNKKIEINFKIMIFFKIIIMTIMKLLNFNKNNKTEVVIIYQIIIKMKLNTVRYTKKL